MEKYYLAIDIGASSGRHILAHMKDGKMVLEELDRASGRKGLGHRPFVCRNHDRDEEM